jgi:predicted PurR-regulated permease PerM
VTQNGGVARDLTRSTLNVLTILLLIVACFWVLRPFAGGFVWATMIVVTTWPVLLRVQRGLGGRRWAAVLVMTLALLAVFVVPLLVTVGTFIANLDRMSAWVQSMIAAGIPGPPSWMERVPFVGTKIAARWGEMAAMSPADLRERLAPHTAAIVRWLGSTVGTIGGTLVQLLLMVVLSAVLYSTGEAAGSGAIRMARRLGGESGEGAIRLAGQAVRAVALGVVGTAIIQAALAGIGLFVADVPFAGALTAVIFVTCIAQLGPLPILAPCVGWMYWSGNPGWGTALLVWSLFVGTIDNVIRPLLIKRGADLSLLLIFAGVIGGLIAFGVVGLFVGPVLLAVTYTLGSAWVRSGETAAVT